MLYFCCCFPPGRGPTGQVATCVALTAGGGLSFQMRRGSTAGYQPFDGVQSISFWLVSNAAAGATAGETSTPRGQVSIIFADSRYDVQFGCLTAFRLASSGMQVTISCYCGCCCHPISCGSPAWALAAADQGRLRPKKDQSSSGPLVIKA